MAGSLRQRGKTSWQLRALAGRDEITGKKTYVSKTFRGGRREAERELARWSPRSRRARRPLLRELWPSCATSGSSTRVRTCRPQSLPSIDVFSIGGYCLAGLDAGSPTPYIGTRRLALAAPSIWFGDRRTPLAQQRRPGPRDSPTCVEPRRSLGMDHEEPCGRCDTATSAAAPAGHPLSGRHLSSHRSSRDGEPGATGVHQTGGCVGRATWRAVRTSLAEH